VVSVTVLDEELLDDDDSEVDEDEDEEDEWVSVWVLLEEDEEEEEELPSRFLRPVAAPLAASPAA